MSALIADWLLTYLVHSSLLIALVWAVTRTLRDARLPLREALWRVALVGGLITASLQLAIGVEPWSGSWSLTSPPELTASDLVAEPAPGAVAGRERVGAPSPRLDLAPAASLPPIPEPLGSITRAGVDHRWLVAGWAAGATLLGSLLLASYGTFRRRLRGRSPLIEGRLPAVLERLRAETRCRAVRLSRTERIGVPLARGVRNWEICLPSTALERLPLERQEIVVAHELAHLRRYDPLWFALQRVIERVLFIQPLNVVARRQLQEIAEFRCDDWAVEVTRRPISLAKCLTEVAEWNLDSGGTVPVPTMSIHKSQLGRRVARLLKRSYPMPTERLPRWLIPVALTLLVLIVLVAPGVSSRTSEAALIEPHAVRADDAEAPRPPAPPAPPDEPSGPAAIADAPPAPPAAPPSSTVAPDVPVLPAPPSAPTPPPAPTGPLTDQVVLPAPPLPALAPLAPRADLEPELWRAHGRDMEAFAESYAELAAGLEAELQGDWLPTIAGLELEEARLAEMAESAAALAADWKERWDPEQRLEVERLQRLSGEIAQRLPSEEELERLRERLPSDEEMARMRERAARAMAETHQRLQRQRARMMEMSEAEREARERTREEIRRSMEERRELLERTRVTERLSAEQREEYRETLRRTREELREQLRMIEQELEREDELRERGVRE